MAAVFDMLDGMIARILHATSEIGAELDSLCDIVSFGIAPSFMLYKAFFFQYGNFGILIASLPALAGAYRLARFNSQLKSFEDKLYFKGLPIPGGALTIISFVMFYLLESIPYCDSLWSALIVTCIVALAMISNIRFNNFPRPNLQSFKAAPIMFIGVIIAFISFPITNGKSLFPLMLLYILLSFIRGVINKIKMFTKNADN